MLENQLSMIFIFVAIEKNLVKYFKKFTNQFSYSKF